MKNTWISGFFATVLLLVLTASAASADSGKPKKFKAKLSGFLEVPVSISTAGNGEFPAKVNESETTITYELEYEDLEGGAVLAAHVHIGQRATAGGVMFFLCGGGGKPACPSSGTVTGTVVAADIIGPAAQGVSPGRLAEAERFGPCVLGPRTPMFIPPPTPPERSAGKSETVVARTMITTNKVQGSPQRVSR